MVKENSFGNRVDLRTIDNGRLINPSPSDDKNAHALSVGDLNIPVEFKLLDSGHFRLNGVLKEISLAGFVVSGYCGGNKAKINHIIVDENLRDYARTKGARIGETVLKDLESCFHEKGVNDLYAIFYTPSTIDFFLRNGYQVLSADSLDDSTKKTLLINSSDLNKKVSNEKSYKEMILEHPEGYKQVILYKSLT